VSGPGPGAAPGTSAEAIALLEAASGPGELFGDGLQAGVPFDALVAEVTAKWDTYYILPAGASYAGDAQVLGFWREGAQGVLLDEWRGFHPYTTWSRTTFANAETLLAEAGEAGLRLGVVRCYLLLRARPVYDDYGCGLGAGAGVGGGLGAGAGPDWAGAFEEVLGAPIALRSYGPAAADKREVPAGYLARA